MSTRLQARARLKELYTNARRDVYFEAIRSEITQYYLADPSNPYQQSGRHAEAPAVSVTWCERHFSRRDQS